MKNLTLLTFLVAVLALFCWSERVQAQDPGDAEFDMPFIDRDGDGINDMMQHGWGLRFVERYKRRKKVWEQLNVEIIKSEDGPKVDTNGDGLGDIDLRDYMKSKMNELIDTDGDGKPDTALRDYLGRRFKAFDANGDGLPDEITKEQMRNYMRRMQEWRREIRNRVKEGLPPFIDANDDGIPDNLPNGFGWRGFRRGKGGKG